MDFLNMANELISGYGILPDNIRREFEETDAGQEFVQTINQLKNNLKAWDNSTSREQRIDSARAYILYALRSSKEYRELIQQIDNTERKATLYEWTLKHIKHSYSELLDTTYFRHFNAMRFEPFNHDQAASTLVNKTLTGNKWLEYYEASLLEHIKKNIRLVNGNEPFPIALILSKENVVNSLSKLYSYMCSVREKQKEVKWCIDKVCEAADAHAFLQATGFATQNETSLLAGFDLINYFRLAGHVAEAKSILAKFIQPFAPLLVEYSDINREQNIVRQIARTIMPMLIVAGTVILVSALLSSFVIPEIASLFILLPTIYLGLVIASSYVVAKDLIYNGFRQYWWGQYNISEYLVNDAMRKTFGSDDKAQKVQEFYVKEIKACVEKEMDYHTQARLTKVEQHNREQNIERHRVLQLEWYDIHSNPNLVAEEARDIALNRLILDGRKACDSIHKELEHEVKKEIPAFIHDVADEIKTSIDLTIHPRRFQTGPGTVTRTAQPRFFTQPACFKHRVEVVRLHELKEELVNVRTSSRA